MFQGITSEVGSYIHYGATPTDNVLLMGMGLFETLAP